MTLQSGDIVYTLGKYPENHKGGYWHKVSEYTYMWVQK